MRGSTEYCMNRYAEEISIKKYYTADKLNYY